MCEERGGLGIIQLLFFRGKDLLRQAKGIFFGGKLFCQVSFLFQQIGLGMSVTSIPFDAIVISRTDEFPFHKHTFV